MNSHDMGEPLMDCTAALEQLRSDLPPGITATLQLIGAKLFVNYAVRAMYRGKRTTIGTFYTKEAAVGALFHYKCHGVLKKMTSEPAVRQAMQAAERQTVQAIAGLSSSGQLAASHALACELLAKPIELTPSAPQSSPLSQTAASQQQTTVQQTTVQQPAMSMQELDDLMVETGTPGYLFTGEEAISIPLAQPGPSGESSVLISAAQQVEYNAWLLEKFASESAAEQQAETDSVEPSDSATRQAQED
jgi:hypothetical protein